MSLDFELTSEGSGGALTAIKTVAAPQDGPPLHIRDEDEVIYTLEGTFRVKLDDRIERFIVSASEATPPSR